MENAEILFQSNVRFKLSCPTCWPTSPPTIVGQHVGTVCYRCWPNKQHVVDEKMLAKIFIDLIKIDVLVRFAMSRQRVGTT